MAADSRVLVVDDNPLILGLLERALKPLAAVTMANSAADALRMAEENPPDLIISDFQMPDMDGRQLLEKLRESPATARIPMVLSASRTDVSERLRSLQDSVEDFLEKPYFVGEATAKIKRILHKIALEKMARGGAPGETTVRGSLAQMGVIDLLQSLELGRKNCELTFRKKGHECHVYFSEGQLNHAVYGDLRGDDAVYKVLAWPEGEGVFQIDFAASSSEQTTTRSTQGLLMEGLRLLDEANRDKAE